MTLTEFLLARIAEDEEMAQAVLDARPEDQVHSDGAWAVAMLPEPVRTHVLRHGPLRVLAECQAMRDIIEAHPSWLTLSSFAAVYADHPEYRQEWRG